MKDSLKELLACCLILGALIALCSGVAVVVTEIVR